MEERKKGEGVQLKFGIPKSEYERIEEASSLQSIYDFNEKQSELSFYLSEQFDIPMKDAFEIVWRCFKAKEEETDGTV